MFQEDMSRLETVNALRDRVRDWRKRNYPGIAPITRQLLEQCRTEREPRLFFCQREAAQTLIWLVESHRRRMAGAGHPRVDGELARYVCKMTTGSGGKTVHHGHGRRLAGAQQAGESQEPPLLRHHPAAMPHPDHPRAAPGAAALDQELLLRPL